MSQTDKKDGAACGPDSLRTAVVDWIAQEGYPLEFSTAAAFSNARFHSQQGVYTQQTKTEPPREIDVVADMSSFSEDLLLRVAFVVECKWTADKPWVLFTSGRSLTTAACATQSVGSLLGEAVLWKEAGCDAFEEMNLFASSPPMGYGGRQAFSQKRDVVFDALRSVTNASRRLALQYDQGSRTGQMPHAGFVAFPTIVIQGRLFEVAAGSEDTLEVLEVPRCRLHWGGSPDWTPYSTVDVVTIEALPDFARTRAAECRSLLQIMESGAREIEQAIDAGSLEGLTVTRGARGVLGAPSLLQPHVPSGDGDDSQEESHK